MFLNLEQPFSWETLKKAVGGFTFRRELTVQDMLREQARQRQFDVNGGDGISSGRGGDGSGGPEDECFAGQVDEFLQVIMAVVGAALLVSFSSCLHFCKFLTNYPLFFLYILHHWANYVPYNLSNFESLSILLVFVRI